jgi:hypothetical protein
MPVAGAVEERGEEDEGERHGGPYIDLGIDKGKKMPVRNVIFFPILNIFKIYFDRVRWGRIGMLSYQCGLILLIADALHTSLHSGRDDT